jgi:predicted ester cyclase
MTASDSRKAVVRRLFEEGLNERRLEVLDEIVAADFVLHSAMLGDIRGRDAYRRGVEGLLQASPDLHGTLEALLSAEDDHVIARISYTGTDAGGFMTGQPGTGKPFATTALYLFRLEGHQLKELWQEADRARILQQLARSS